MPYQTVPDSVRRFMDRITELCGAEHADWAENFNAAFANTLTTTVHRHADGTTFLLTGDIPPCGCATPPPRCGRTCRSPPRTTTWPT